MNAVAMSEHLLEQRPLLERYLKETARPLSAFSFVNLFAWKDFFDFEITPINGDLCVFASTMGTIPASSEILGKAGSSDRAGTFLYLPPLGKELKPQTIEECVDWLRKRNGGSGPGVGRIENVPAEQLGLFPENKFRRLFKGREYCYYRQDLVDLKGNDYKSKRSDYNHFIRNHRARYRPFSPTDKEECLALYDRWAAGRRKSQRDEMYLHMLEDNRKVQEGLWEHDQSLGLIGRVVCVNDKIVGYTCGYALNDDIFCVLFEITDLSLKGLPVYIFREFCADPDIAGFRFINAMDDFGLENIEKTKLSFRPGILWSSYVVTPQY